ncbi:MAG: B12-binding domain-containing radical SAM protein [Methanomicrobiaceae archaeon]|nr:B12-binding domain-containing radical SAM protein [Methanomicrobiaceae archaeon]
MKILLVVYDNDSYVSWFPQGIAYIASACRNAGHDVTIYNQDVYHYTEEHLLEYLNRNQFDAIGLGACGGYYQYRKILKLCDAINQSDNRPPLWLGGHLVSPDPEYFLRKTKADAIVLGEGELTVVEFLDAIRLNTSLSTVKGLAYLDDNNRCIITEERELIEDVDSIPLPAWDLFPIDHYALIRLPNMKNADRCMPVLSGRGCIFNCNFCYRMDKGFRPRSSESIIEEIEILKKDYNISHISFADELFMSSNKRTIELCNNFINANLDVTWECNGRLNYAKPDVLDIMKKAGCVFINYGIESMDDVALKNMNKKLTVRQIVSGIENTLAAGISPGFNIIFGNIGETKEILGKGVDFILKYDDHAQFRTIRPVTPYPGSPLYYYAIEKGMIKDCEDFYENKHTNSDLLTVNFTDMSDAEYYESLYEANAKLIENYYTHQKAKIIDMAKELYLNQNSDFRGFRQS